MMLPYPEAKHRTRCLRLLRHYYVAKPKVPYNVWFMTVYGLLSEDLREAFPEDIKSYLQRENISTRDKARKLTEIMWTFHVPYEGAYRECLMGTLERIIPVLAKDLKEKAV